ncbi:hypothetical protein BJQ90_01578 [Arthrobacter sp. SO3]|nr:hypothetical protein [Arthrobacter sp. SO3]
MVKWATEALDEVRRSAWNDARKAARTTEARRGRGGPAKDAPARPDPAHYSPSSSSTGSFSRTQARASVALGADRASLASS